MRLNWGGIDAQQRGPVVGTLAADSRRNAIGAHSGSYAVYRALAVASGALDAEHRPDLTNRLTDPSPFPLHLDRGTEKGGL